MDKSVVSQFLIELDLENSPIRQYYNQSSDSSWRTTLQQFLSSTMDEVRSTRAREFANITLKIHDTDDTDHFRLGVLRREASGRIAYSKQRDHSAHTVNNWLLGWYFYGHAGALATAINLDIELRQVTKERTASLTFGGIWQYTSLLHDIGYIFEGSVDALASDTFSEYPRSGVRIVQDYFSHRAWHDLGILSQSDRDCTLKMTGLIVPDFSKADSLAGIAHCLRELPQLERLREAVRHKVSSAPDCLTRQNGLPPDAFDLWRAHYRAHNKLSMVARVEAAEREFYRLIYDGVVDGVRILDHGVTGGMVLLMYATFFYCLHHGLGSEPSGADERRLWTILRRNNFDYQANYWWGGLVWASASTALHNLLQSGALGPLAIEEDALTYLGILVDILQEWDRYSVGRSSMLGYGHPIQGVDVQLFEDNGRVVIDYGDVEEERAMKVRKDLDRALKDWQALVEVRPPLRSQ